MRIARGKRGQQMLGAGEAVEVAADRAEAVIRADRPIIEILDLLQHRIRPAICEDVAGDQQNRQPVDMRQRGGSNHVGGARADRGGDRHAPCGAAWSWHRR